MVRVGRVKVWMGRCHYRCRHLECWLGLGYGELERELAFDAGTGARSGIALVGRGSIWQTEMTTKQQMGHPRSEGAV